MNRLQNKITIVTGAGSGIGRAIALRFAAEGATVVAVARRQETLDNLADEAEGDVVPFACDVSIPEQVEGLLTACRERFGRLDVLANNAGTGGDSLTPLHEISLESWDTVMNTNVRGMFLVLKHAIPLMLASGGGSVVNMASVGSFRASAGSGAYITSKGAVLMMTRVAALDYVHQNIRVNAVCPGIIKTAILDGVPESLLDELSGSVPQGRLGTPEEVASVALFLASDEASHVTGASYVVDGGRMAG